MEASTAWELVQGALDELALAFEAVTSLGSLEEQVLYKAETMLLMVRQDELINELALLELSSNAAE